jgi:chromosome segregation ATPase
MERLPDQIERIIIAGKRPTGYDESYRILDLFELKVMHQRAQEADKRYLSLVEHSRDLTRDSANSSKELKKLQNKIADLESIIHEYKSDIERLKKKAVENEDNTEIEQDDKSGGEKKPPRKPKKIKN